MEWVKEFTQIYFMYCRELWLTLAVGFLISGLFYKFVPTKLVERHLGERGVKPILIAALVGTILPVCCIGSLPIAVTFRRKGAALGAVLAFLVATPATSISALIVCWKLMGLVFTAYIFVTIIITAVIIGVVVNAMAVTQKPEGAIQPEEPSCCSPQETSAEQGTPSIRSKLFSAVYYAFVTIPKEMGLEILLGIGIASFISAFEPIQHFIQSYLSGFIGYLVILPFGLLTYVCSTASVPMADALVHSAMSYGQAFCYLMVGPITSYGTILVIRKEFGGRILAVYLVIISLSAVCFGLFYDYFIHPA